MLHWFSVLLHTVVFVVPGFPNVFLSLLVQENPVETLETGGVEDAIEQLTCKNYKINRVACHVGFL